MEHIFKNNYGTFTKDELEKLRCAKVLVIGCGGSGYVIDELVRLGIENIGVVDGDVFEETNLNRQLFSNIQSIGKLKVEVAKKHAENINPNIQFKTYPVFVTKENCHDFVRSYDIVLDCVDNIESKLVIQKACSELGIPLVFGGMSRWYGQVGVSFPGDDLLEKVYSVSKSKRKGHLNEEERSLLSSTTSFMNAFVSSLYVAMCAKVLVGRKCPHKRLYLYDLCNMRLIRLRIGKKLF